MSRLAENVSDEVHHYSDLHDNDLHSTSQTWVNRSPDSLFSFCHTTVTPDAEFTMQAPA